jgi:cephalosporin-C deacetylase-like acetyl esterase
MKIISRYFILPLLVLFSLTGVAQPKQTLIDVVISADHDDWTYRVGEKVKFSVEVYEHGNLVHNVPLKYEFGPERMDPVKEDSVVLRDGKLTIDGGTMKQPGFLRCVVVATVKGEEYRGLATAGFEPDHIQAVAEMPADFQQFWTSSLNELAKVPVDPKMTLLPDRCTPTVNVYHVKLQNYRPGTYLYGILCVPKKEGKYPALLQVPGAGVRPYHGDIKMAEQGLITFQIGIHGVPVDMDTSVYNNLGAGALRGYWTYNLDSRDNFYYKRVYLGCIRANDFLTSLPQFDGKNLAVYGGSQGGALSIITASLDKRVKYLASYYPALCDLTGYLKGRAGGWPHYFDKTNIVAYNNNTKDKINTAGYYDVVNFARNLTVPGIYSWGFNDETCPPTSTFAAYNVIKAPKELFLAVETGHWTFPEQGEKVNKWLLSKLKAN